MSEIINLNRARKARDRAQAAAAATQNRLTFGTRAVEKSKARAIKAKAIAALDGHKREP